MCLVAFTVMHMPLPSSCWKSLPLSLFPYSYVLLQQFQNLGGQNLISNL